jgi:hypothetical protein
MPLVVRDRVRVTSTTTGTGTLTLGAASFGFQSFSVVGDGNTTYYTIVDPATGAWEVGIGTYTASGTTLSRTTVLESSNAGSLVNFAAGTKDVFLTYPAERSVYLDESSNLNVTTNTASTSTTTGTVVVTGGLGVSGRINAANFDGIIGANTAAAGSFTTLAASSPASFAAGTAALPAITRTGDTNTGIFFPAADTIAFSEGGAESMRIDSSGNVGIGTAAFSLSAAGRGLLEINGSTDSIIGFKYGGTVAGYIQASASALNVNSSSTQPLYFTAGGTTQFVAFQTNSAERMRIDSSGNVGIGTTSPTLPLNIGTSTLPAGVTIAGQMISSDVAAAAPLLSIRRSAASGNPIFAQFTSSGTAASPTAVALNRGLGRNDWWGFDGTNYINAAAITCAADGAVSTGVVPGRMVFHTSATNTPVERMRIDSAGNVGIGTSTPGAALHVAGAITGSPTGNGALLGIDGNYGVMHLNGSSGGYIDFSTSGTDFKGRIIYDNTTNFMSFYTNTAEAMRINTSGKVFMGTTTNPTANADGILNLLSATGDGINIKHTVDGNNTINIWQTGTTNFSAIVFYKSNTQVQVGDIVCSTFGTTYNTTSDYRLKENVRPLSGALNRIMQLEPSEWNWKADGSQGVGFIAHKVQEIRPQAVTGTKDAVNAKGKPVYQGMDASYLIADLTAAIQELKAEIDLLKGK